MKQRWAVVGVPERVRDGGSSRAWHLFRALIERTNALEFYRPGLVMMTRAVSRPRSLLPGVNVAAAELVPQISVNPASRMTHLRVLDLHDDPVLQREAFGIPFAPGERDSLLRLTETNVRAFDRVIVVSQSFADLAAVPPDKTWVTPNGTDTAAIRPGAWPPNPSVGFVSGAAPGRGIEALVGAMRLVRQEIHAELLLALIATGSQSREYLAGLRARLAQEPWVLIESVPNAELGTFLARCSVLTVPHPSGAYMDAALPVKLFDSMAAGRPLVVTPRIETARLVTTLGCGVVSASDREEDLAAAILAVLRDEAAARRMGSAARSAAEERFDWRLLAREVATRLTSARSDH
jgi:glycosyltransferase involved in cell wall biosynthesis